MLDGDLLSQQSDLRRIGGDDSDVGRRDADVEKLADLARGEFGFAKVAATFAVGLTLFVEVGAGGVDELDRTGVGAAQTVVMSEDAPSSDRSGECRNERCDSDDGAEGSVVRQQVLRPIDHRVVDAHMSETAEPDQPQSRHRCDRDGCEQHSVAACRSCGAEAVETSASCECDPEHHNEGKCDEVDHCVSFKMAASCAASAGSSASANPARADSRSDAAWRIVRNR